MRWVERKQYDALQKMSDRNSKSNSPVREFRLSTDRVNEYNVGSPKLAKGLDKGMSKSNSKDCMQDR